MQRDCLVGGYLSHGEFVDFAQVSVVRARLSPMVMRIERDMNTSTSLGSPIA